MKYTFEKYGCVKTKKSLDLKGQIRRGNSWYVGDQFEQLNNPGARDTIEHRWACFGGIFLHYLKSEVSINTKESLCYLDAGCGDGINLQWATRFFRENNINIRVTALDYNSLRICKVLENQLAEVAYVASLLEAPFDDSTFDMILCNHVLEHTKQYPQVLAEIMRILKPGGLLVLGVPNEGCFLARLRNKVFQRSILKDTDQVNFFKSDMLIKALSVSGFNVLRIYREGFFFPHSWAHYVLTYFSFGRRLFSILGRIFPSQSADLIIYTIKPLKQSIARNWHESVYS